MKHMVTVMSVIAVAAPAAADVEDRILHIPPATWSAGSDHRLTAEVTGDWQLRRVWVGIRPIGTDDPFADIDMLRASDDRFTAVVSAELVQPPGLEYFIEVERLDGSVEARFATRDEPHPLPVHGETDQTRIDDRLARHDGHRSSLRLDGEWTRYGSRLAHTRENGFSAGFGGLIRVGRIAATRWELGFEALSDTGTLTFMRFAWNTVPRVPMSLGVEISDWPDGDVNPAGTRLLYDLGWEASDNVTLVGRFGYASRSDGIEGGTVFGLSTVLEF
jgi:hypothetical protein